MAEYEVPPRRSRRQAFENRPGRLRNPELSTRIPVSRPERAMLDPREREDRPR